MYHRLSGIVGLDAPRRRFWSGYGITQARRKASWRSEPVYLSTKSRIDSGTSWPSMSERVWMDFEGDSF